MPVKFTPDCPAGLAIQRIIREDKDGLKIPQIRRELIKIGIKGLSERDIKEILNHPEVFTASPDGTYRLRAYAIAEEGRKDFQYKDKKKREEKDKVRSTLVDIPPLDSFIIFDLETTGLNPQRDEIIQIAAIKIKAREVIEVRNWYINPTKKIPYTLKLKLNFDKFPEIEEKVKRSPPIEDVIKQFNSFIDDVPLVAHNGVFDYSFLKKALSNLTNKLVDSLEIACLVCPHLPNHRLETLADYFGFSKYGVKRGEIEELYQRLHIAEKLGISFSWEGYHNALIDCIILYKVFGQLLEEAKGLENAIRKEILRFFPYLQTIFGGNSFLQDHSPDDLFRIISQEETEEGKPFFSIGTDFTEEQILEEFKNYIAI